MAYRQRIVQGRFLSLHRAFPAVVVVGARQVGKTTFVRRMLEPEGADIVVFDALADVEGARAEPDLFLDAHRRPLILDEIQYAPEVVPALKRRIDLDRRPGQYVLTGSQQWQVQRSLAESLAGRAVFLDLEGFCLSEIAGRPDGQSWLERWLDDPHGFIETRHERLASPRPLYEQLWRGFLPEAQDLALDVVPDFLDAYQRTYIERDARLAGDVRDWQEFARFYRLCGALSAQEVNQTQLGRDIGATAQTARRWLDMLVATFQWYEVAPWSGNVVQRISRKPKGYVADAGLMCSALRISTPRALPEHPALGAVFETAVVGEVRRLAAAMAARPGLFHWRGHARGEVDLVLERDGTFYPLEVRITARPAVRDTAGIEAFRAANPGVKIAPGLVLCAAPSAFRLSEHVLALPWDSAPGAS